MALRFLALSTRTSYVRPIGSTLRISPASGSLSLWQIRDFASKSSKSKKGAKGSAALVEAEEGFADSLQDDPMAAMSAQSSAPKKAAMSTQQQQTQQNPELLQQQKDALAVALAKINKQFGKGTVSQLGSQPAYDTSRVISTGSLAIDDALGVGGLPQGRIVEIFGPEASGKTCTIYDLYFMDAGLTTLHGNSVRASRPTSQRKR